MHDEDSVKSYSACVVLVGENRDTENNIFSTVSHLPL